MKRILLSLLLLFVGTLGAAAQVTTVEYYVSDSGSDANAGTASAPFRTVQKCVDRFNDTTQVICNCQGTFNEEIVVRKGGPSPTSRSKIIAWDTDNDGDRSDEAFTIDGEGTRNQALTATLPDRPDNIEIGWVTFQNYDPDGGCNNIDDAELQFIRLKCSGSGGCADWWIHDNKFEKLGKACNVESHYIAIQPSDCPRMIIENNRFDSIGGFLMRYVGGTGIVFRNNYVRIVGTGIKAWDDPDSIQIVGNIFECDGNGINKPGDTRCGGQSAVSLSNNVAASQIKDNIFLDCVTAINLATDDRFGTKKNGPHVVEGNRIYQTGKVCNRYAPAVEISDCSDVTVFGDSVYVFDVTIRNNVIAWVDSTKINLGAAFILNSGHPFPFENNFRIYNNTIRSYGRGILMSLCNKSGVPYTYQMNNVTMFNNVFTDIKDEFFTLSGLIANWPDSSRALNWRSDNNTFSGRDRITWGGIRYTLAQWKTARGQDSNSRLGTPTFVAEVNAAQPLLKPARTDTVAQNHGKSLADVMQDFSKRSRPMGGAWDVGAHEVVDKRIYFASATTGDDNKLGTADQPFRTIQRGLDLWNATEQFELRGAGSFNEEAVVRHGGISADSMNTILPWDTDNDGSLDDETFAFDGENNHAVALSTDSLTSPDYVEIQKISFRNYAPASCAQGEEARFIRLLGNDQDSVEGWSIHDNNFSNLATACDLSTKQSAIRGTWVKNLRVERNHFDSISGYLLNGIRGASVDFRDNVATLIGGGVRTSYSVDSLRIVGNRFVGDGNGANGSNGACRQQWGVNLINGVQYGLIAGNEFIGTSGGVRFGINESGERNNAHHVVEKNLIYLNDAACNANRPGIVLADCSGVSTGGDSLWIEDVLVRNNVLVFDGEADSSNGGIKLASGHPYNYENDWRIYNNTIAGFKRGILVQASEEEDGSPSEYLLNGVQVKNNLFSDISDAHYKFETGVWESSLPNGWTSDYNVYGGIDRFRWEGKKSLAKWRTKTGQDAHSVICSASFVANDSLYHLSSTDNCGVDVGVSLTEVDEDIDGESRPSGGGYDVGADERVGGGLARLIARGDESGEAEGGERIVIYPHPVTDRGTIRVVVPEGWKDVRAIVYDGASRQVANLMFESAPEPGEYELEWSTDGLASGIYIVVVESEEGRIVEQVIVEKKN